MLRPLFLLGLLLALGGGSQVTGWSQEKPAAEGPRTITFDQKEALAGWTVDGDIAIDRNKSRHEQGGSLKIGPKSRALLKLRDKDGSGKVEMWVYDDGTTPQDVKAARVGPRWGLVQSNGNVLAAGILYQSYLGGAEGYTATACDARDWFKQLFWMGVKRGPAGWHNWIFDFDPEGGLQVLHDGKEVNAIDSSKVGLEGFSAIAIWGDEGLGQQQTIWVADFAVSLGGPVKIIPAGEADPYDDRAVTAATTPNRPLVVYTTANAPAVPNLQDLPLKESVSQYGITWTFEKPARVGKFINGDWYVLGPVTIQAIDPRPLYGSEIPKGQLDHMDKERKAEQRVRNGFMLNPPATMKVAYDSGVRNFFDPALIQKLPWR